MVPSASVSLRTAVDLFRLRPFGFAVIDRPDLKFLSSGHQKLIIATHYIQRDRASLD